MNDYYGKFSLKEEIRNGYFVPSWKKRIWDKQLDIFSTIKSICEKHNIKYFAACGTLIGAVRENGFIPRDDDIDLGMTRENLKKFIAVAKKELPNNYEIVGLTLTKKLFRGHLQVRDKNTTCLAQIDFKVNYCKGLWVDIFVFDKFPANDKENYKFRKKLGHIHKILSYFTFYRSSSNILEQCWKFFLSRTLVLFFGGFKKCNKLYNKLCQSYDGLEDGYYYDYLAFRPQRVLKIPPHTFDVLVDHKFENTSIKIPKFYSDVLAPEYGKDFMVRKEASNGHGNVFIDLDNSYLKYEDLSRKDFNKLFDTKVEDIL